MVGRKPRTAIEIERRFPQLGQRIRTVVQYAGLKEEQIHIHGRGPESLSRPWNMETVKSAYALCPSTESCLGREFGRSRRWRWFPRFSSCSRRRGTPSGESAVSARCLAKPPAVHNAQGGAPEDVVVDLRWLRCPSSSGAARTAQDRRRALHAACSCSRARPWKAALLDTSRPRDPQTKRQVTLEKIGSASGLSCHRRKVREPDLPDRPPISAFVRDDRGGMLEPPWPTPALNQAH